jgi:hypothetical protein
MTRMPVMLSARLPMTAAMRARVSRKATRDRRVNKLVRTTITGSTLKVSSARVGLIEIITATMPISSRLLPARVSMPCESKSLMTDTSLMTREMVTPTMCVS